MSARVIGRSTDGAANERPRRSPPADALRRRRPDPRAQLGRPDAEPRARRSARGGSLTLNLLGRYLRNAYGGDVRGVARRCGSNPVTGCEPATRLVLEAAKAPRGVGPPGAFYLSRRGMTGSPTSGASPRRATFSARRSSCSTSRRPRTRPASMPRRKRRVCWRRRSTSPDAGSSPCGRPRAEPRENIDILAARGAARPAACAAPGVDIDEFDAAPASAVRTQ